MAIPGSIRIIVLSIVSLANCDIGSAVEHDTRGPGNARVVFDAIGDVPRSSEQTAWLEEHLQHLSLDVDFVVHVGDIKSGATPCDDAVYRRVATILQKSPRPVFIIPGDNEWNDCAAPNNAWGNWTKHFSRFEQRWSPGFCVWRQRGRRENFVFRKNQVLFIGLNLVGGRVHDPEEWNRRLREDVEWTTYCFRRFGKSCGSVVIFGHAGPSKNHDPYFDAMAKLAEKFSKPVLYLHGDRHQWQVQSHFMAENILRVGIRGEAEAVQVIVTNDPNEPFTLVRQSK